MAASSRKGVKKANLTGFGTSAGPAPFRGGVRGTVYGKGNRPKSKTASFEDRMQASNLYAGQARDPQQRNLLGPRISHINKGAIANTYLLEGLHTGQTKQTQIFNRSPIASRARQTGRPLGHGTVYKFF